MDIKAVHRVYFLGIGGIGMSALARYFHHLGKAVAGYDKTRTPLTQELEGMGIAVAYEDHLDAIPPAYHHKEGTLVVYTPAVPEDHSGIRFYREAGFEMYKRAKVLGMITRDTFCFAVAGTHGKTTTSCILAHLLDASGTQITAFLGGISEDFNSNFLMKGPDYTVVEADEFDRSFLHLSPDIACITSMDADHLDIYGDHEQLKQSFREFAAKLKPKGTLFVNNGLPINGLTYGIDDNSDYCALNVRVDNGTYIFDLKTPESHMQGIRFNKPGRHNLLNGVAAMSMALKAGSSPDKLVEAMGTFKGVQRRFSYAIKQEGLVFIDDYAHHPTEINAVYEAVQEMHPNKRTTVLFQPHLYSRTRDFGDAFARSLEKFDRILLLDIYPAREKPIPGITSEWLLEKINNPNKKRIKKDEIIPEITAHSPEVFITLGAGDIGLEINGIKKQLAHAI
ncbi:UDP-N-acetylmuramate--L-alanine ligase [Lentiprolixibacter aurantiacus]|uniref:UDP-N-acetylmuramate--L-alanine ligase n=1 Tax=Lentiprolixibacter aurantiacus TaxID=2993939 RepID=A0AAE3SMY7_9FLAO|nr:UDP-N-acetylmuramate--L-alanine ligase [Lentiprolixibacter aurantiacus]MCX2719172.1 UDP-N-acetylmuramate--L-alanine ligase [Lentiprolixibacter aurantiacus]